MSETAQQVSVWQLEGRCLDLVFKDGKPKRLRLMTADGEYTIKLAKALRSSIEAPLIAGAWVQVGGVTKTNPQTDAIKLKADRISITPPGQTKTLQPVKAVSPASATILVCQKADCMKRGGKAVCQALETALSDRHLTAQVNIRSTGCMKQCKAGPHIVFMPEKNRYSHVSAHNVAALVDEHFPHCSVSEDSMPSDSVTVSGDKTAALKGE